MDSCIFAGNRKFSIAELMQSTAENSDRCCECDTAFSVNKVRWAGPVSGYFSLMSMIFFKNECMNLSQVERLRGDAKTHQRERR